MSKVITTKKIKISSRGRYVTKRGVVFGPCGNFYSEKVETIRELLTKYADIVIIEQLKDKSTIQLNLDNVDKDNTRKPISMMEAGDDSNPDKTPGEEKKEEQSAVHVDATPAEKTADDETDDVVIDGTSDDSAVVMTEETPAEKTADGEKVEEAPVEEKTSNETVEETPVEEKKEEQPKQTNTNSGKKNKNKNKGNNQQNKAAAEATTEVTPVEA